MLQVAFIRNNPALVKERLGIRNFKETDLVDIIVSLDDERKRLQFEFDETQSKINAASKEIGQLMAKGEKDAAEKRKEEVASLKSSLQPINTNLAGIEKKLQDEIIKLPNLPHTSVPAGKTPEENVVVEIETKGKSLAAETVFGTVEAVKTVSDLFLPVSGTITEINPALESQPELVNTDPYGEGWMIKMTVDNPGDVDNLMDAAAYEKLVS